MRRKTFCLIGLLLVLVLVLAACSSNDETEQPEAAQPSPETTELVSTIPAPTADGGSQLSPDQQSAYDRLTGEVGFEPELLMEMGIARFIAPYLPTESADPESAARNFFETYSGLYGVDNINQALQLTQNMYSGNLVRFQQYFADLPVFGGQAIVSFTQDGLISFVNSALQPTTSIGTDAKLDQQEAANAAIAYSGDAQAELARGPQLMVFSPVVLKMEESAPSLVWEIGLLVDQGDGGPPAAIQYLVDAVNGDIVFEVPEDFNTENWDLYSAQNSATSDPTPVPLYDKLVQWYSMRDGKLATVIDPNGQPLADAEGMAAQANMSTTWDYFFNTHSWDGHDDKGGTCNLFVHVGSGWRNATCGKTCNCAFGDAGGGFASPLDVVAHEFTHAITGQTAGLIYQLESGALNEHYSDFFATMVETSDWLVSGPTSFRNLADPPGGSAVSPDHYDEFRKVNKPTKNNDNGNVHRNSGIPNKASFMVADTGTNIHPDSGVEVQGLGRDVAEQIWFQTLVTLSPSTGMYEWAASTVGTAYRLVPDTISEENACQVQYAMQAVGLRQTDCRCDDELECPLGFYEGGGGHKEGDPGEGVVDPGDDVGGTDAAPTSEEGEVTVTPEPSETAEGTNACDHPYMPIRPGSTWSYIDENEQSSEYIVREVSGDENYAEAIVDAVFESSGVILTHTWVCTPDGIRAPFSTLNGIPADVEAVIYGEEDGYLLPAADKLAIGNQWDYATLLVMTITSPDSGTVEVRNNRQEEYTSEQFTSISVPAGEFETLEISGLYTVTTEVLGISKDFPGTETLWFAEGVGLVKDLVVNDGENFIELEDYFIPEP